MTDDLHAGLRSIRDDVPAQVGRAVRRRDLVEKVTGAARYCVDLQRPGMLHARVVRSERAHARILGISTAAAAARPGVAGIITVAELKGIVPRFGHILPDHSILAENKVRYYGEPVAIVVADSPAAAYDAARLVTVAYEDLPAVMTADEALAPGAPLVHEEDYGPVGDESFTVMTGPPRDAEAARTSNVLHEVSIGWGDVEAAFARSALVVEGSMRFPMLYPYAMEPYNALAAFVDGRLEVDTTAQHPFMVRDDLSRVFGLPLAAVTVRSPYVGGGYGSKSYTKVEPLAAVAARHVGKPVKLVLDVEESIYTTRADSAVVTVRSGFDAEGSILARQFDIVFDSGAYADNSPLVLAKAVNRCFGPYKVPNIAVRGRAVYTNTSPASSYRGFGAPLGVLAGETNLERAAEQLGIDSRQLRRRNLARPGEEILPGKRGIDADLVADLDLVAASLDAAQPADTVAYGTGLACSASDAGAFPVSTVIVRMQADGSVIVASGSSEMGQGSNSALAQIAAAELGLELSEVVVRQSDTSSSSYERTTGASRTTTLAGLALQRACAEARNKIVAMAAESAALEPSALEAVAGGVRMPDGTVAGYGEVIRRWFGANAGEVTGVGVVRREGVTQKMPPFWEIGMVGVGCRVDTETGEVRIEQLVTVADVGFAINPQAVEGQDLGAATQGIGMALFEELIYDGAQLVNPNLVDYRVPRVRDLPPRIETMIAERRDGVGPYGAKGAGEGALNPIAAAVVTAVARATGKWADAIPLTPERVWRMLQQDS